MGVDLLGHGDASFSWPAWYHLLEIAKEFGWQPAGTEAFHVFCRTVEWHLLFQRLSGGNG
jgi:hypothetical protein